MNNAIILNKIFEGSWNKIDGNISHEVIDFIETDKGELYAYNDPLGHCPAWVHVGKKPMENGETHTVNWLLLTGPAIINRTKGTSCFEILYRIELEEKLHSYSTSKNSTKFETIKTCIENIIKTRDIKYGGRFLYDIYKEDQSLLVTFKVKKIEKPEEHLWVATKNYRFQRNKGYIKEGENTEDYNTIINDMKNVEWTDFSVGKINSKTKGNKKQPKTFLDLLLKEDSEECYTNILYSILSHNQLINDFCNYLGKPVKSSKLFVVKRELGIVDGRMDICAENDEQKIVIENKIYSGLNGTKKNNPTQLGTYYYWASKNTSEEPICFVTVPDFRIPELKYEINERDPQMMSKFEIVGYSKIVEFLITYMGKLEKYEYFKYLDDIIAIFEKMAYETKEAYYRSLFINA